MKFRDTVLQSEQLGGILVEALKFWSGLPPANLHNPSIARVDGGFKVC